VGDFVGDADRVSVTRPSAKLEELIDGDSKEDERAEQHGRHPHRQDRPRSRLDVKRVEHEHKLDPATPSARPSWASSRTCAMSQARESEIVEAEIVEQPALPLVGRDSALPNQGDTPFLRCRSMTRSRHSNGRNRGRTAASRSCLSPPAEQAPTASATPEGETQPRRCSPS
jgi:hypothetical protein